MHPARVRFKRSRLGLSSVSTLLLVVAAGCSGQSTGHQAGATPAGGQATTTSTTAAGGGSTGSHPSSTTTTITSKSGGPTATSTPSSPPTTSRPGTTPTTTVHTGVPIQVTLGSACVRPGGTQTITIVTEPKSGVVYDAVYSDGKSGASPGFYGGNQGGHTDDHGVWKDTWVVGAAAPPGPVRVDVLAVTPKGKGYTDPWFAVAGPTGKCT